ncbi:MAG: hypothetical protein HY094_05565 [Candidatus Melainabacteria bacterium]|nr:hypothetical protein [Candidatus Melainabacteria bacterium]
MTSIMRKILFIIGLISVITNSSVSLAQDALKPKDTVKAVEKEPNLQEKKVPKAPGATKAQEVMKAPEVPKAPECACAKPARDAVEKAYGSIEEDEWVKAIKACNDAGLTIKGITKTCTCPEVPIYQKVVEAFQKYAEGGNHLDGAEQPNCPYALKLYSDAIDVLSSSLDKIPDDKIKEKVKNVKEYAQEEQQFVKDECQKT